MNRENLLAIAERKIKKAQRALDTNRNRPGITETEIENLENNLKFSSIVYDLIDKYASYTIDDM